LQANWQEYRYSAHVAMEGEALLGPTGPSNAAWHCVGLCCLACCLHQHAAQLHAQLHAGLPARFMHMAAEATIRLMCTSSPNFGDGSRMHCTHLPR
jgi:hypothetical protein